MNYGAGDLSGFFNEFAEDAVLETNGVDKDVRVILSRNYSENEAGYKTEMFDMTATVSSDSVVGVKRNDVLTLVSDQSKWYISKVRPDGTGLSELVLSEDPV